MKKNNISAVLDTNIFISAWFRESEEADKILSLVANRKMRLQFAQDTIGELVYLVKNFARYNISEKSFRVTLLNEVMKLFYYSHSVNTMNTEIARTNDKYDDMFLKCAIEGSSDYLITDDIKSGMLERSNGSLTVMTSTGFVEEYEKEHGFIEA